MAKKLLNIFYKWDNEKEFRGLRISDWMFALILIALVPLILSLFTVTGVYIGKITEKPKPTIVNVTKIDTVFVPVEKPDQVVKLYDAQVRFYDFVLKLIIGVFSLVFIAGGVFLYRDRQQIREEIVGDAKRRVESYEGRLADISKALESLIDQANKIKREQTALKKLAQPDKKVMEVLEDSKRKGEELRKTIMDRITEFDAKLAKQMPLPEKMGTEREAVRLFNAGVGAYESGRIEEAIGKWKEAIKLNPGYAKAHFSLGGAFGVQGKLDEALAEYKNVLLINPENAAAHNNLGNVLSDQGKLEEAITEYREAIRVKPENANPHYNLGILLSDQEKYADAEKEYRIAIRLAPDYARAHYNLGVALGEQGKAEEEIAAYREAIRLKPDDAEAHNNLGVTLSMLGRFEEAEREHNEAIRLQPNDCELYYNLACLYAKQDKKEVAIKRLQTAVDKGLDNWPFMQKEEELNNLRDDLMFKELEEKVKARWEEKQKEEGKG